jgi:hypothetical protein
MNDRITVESRMAQGACPKFKGNIMTFTQPDSGLTSMIEKAIHENIITQPEYEKIVMLSDQDLMIEAPEKRLLDHLQGLMGNRSINKVQR